MISIDEGLFGFLEHVGTQIELLRLQFLQNYSMFLFSTSTLKPPKTMKYSCCKDYMYKLMLDLKRWFSMLLLSGL